MIAEALDVIRGFSPEFAAEFELQWSRDAVIAEARINSGQGLALSKLQWSRDAVIAEAARRWGVHWSGASLLQWSRDAVIAEAEFVCSDHEQSEPLQWSRDAVIAEARE